MKYLLILFVIALALAPLSHFVPSKRQRRIARMREYAAVHGMFVEFRNLPGTSRGDDRRPGAPRGDIIYYGRRLPPQKGNGARRGSWLRDSEGWLCPDRSQPVPASLQQLPADILAASIDEGSCGIYWQEAGSEEEVERIRQALESWSGELHP